MAIIDEICGCILEGDVATIEALEAASIRQGGKVIIGGVPVAETYANQIGADGYAPGASRAAAVTKLQYSHQ